MNDCGSLPRQNESSIFIKRGQVTTPPFLSGGEIDDSLPTKSVESVSKLETGELRGEIGDSSAVRRTGEMDG